MLAIDKGPDARVLDPSLIDKPSSAHFAFAGDFTLETFDVQFFSLTAADLLANYNSSSPFSNQRSWIFGYSGTALQFVGSTNGSTNVTPASYTWNPTLNTPYQIACERSGSTVRLYVDGAVVASGTLSGALHQSTDPFLCIGQRRSGSSLILPFDGKCKAVRITDGVARYAGAYTPPSLPLPAS